MGMDQLGGRASALLVWLSIGVASCGDSRECADAVVDAREARGSSDYPRLQTAIVQAKAFCNGRYAAEIAAWEKQLASAPVPSVAPGPITASPAVTTPAAAIAAAVPLVANTLKPSA